MTDAGVQESTAEQVDAAAEKPGESGQMNERTAKIILFVVGLFLMWGIVTALPEVAYVVVGAAGSVAWRKGRTRWAERHEDGADEGEAEAEPVDVAAALRKLVGDDNGVLLTALRDELKQPDTKTVKGLLDEAGIPWRGVRTRAGNGPAVHKDDIPAAPSPDDGGTHSDRCCCRSGDNANTNTSAAGAPEEGLRVERIGHAGRVVHGTVVHHP